MLKYNILVISSVEKVSPGITRDLSKIENRLIDFLPNNKKLLCLDTFYGLDFYNIKTFCKARGIEN